ncbi:hypothetical protein TSST111916_10260 [Tsukamurella strandjordii]|uniref:hypothetical protein n=1 Tax=Tsukamurella TaxID=2060 RepID=UPI001C7DF081|nr:hypothetical protein [Tsukamurella sp. TY48]GIZ97006.1 hypothetical protein TTY48_16180 [Tsukamurella sp. TY48]
MPLATKKAEPKPPLPVGEPLAATVPGVTLLNWPGAIGKVLAEALDRLDADTDKLHAVLVLAAPDLIDWAAAEYAEAERADRPTLPTEVLNADGCRVFGRATRLGWSGPALALSCTADAADDIAGALATTSGARYSLIADARLTGPDPVEGSIFEVTVMSTDHGR